MGNPFMSSGSSACCVTLHVLSKQACSASTWCVDVDLEMRKCFIVQEQGTLAVCTWYDVHGNGTQARTDEAQTGGWVGTEQQGGVPIKARVGGAPFVVRNRRRHGLPALTDRPSRFGWRRTSGCVDLGDAVTETAVGSWAPQSGIRDLRGEPGRCCAGACKCVTLVCMLFL